MKTGRAWPVRVGLAACACFALWHCDDTALPETPGLQVTVTPLGCAPSPWRDLNGAQAFVEVDWSPTRQRLVVRLIDTGGGTCEALRGGAVRDGDTLIAHYDALSDGPGCALAESSCGGWRHTLVEMTVQGELGLAAHEALLAVMAGADAPDWTDQVIANESLRPEVDFVKQVPVVRDARVATGETFALELDVRLPGEPACFTASAQLIVDGSGLIAAVPTIASSGVACVQRGAERAATLSLALPDPRSNGATQLLLVRRTEPGGPLETLTLTL